MSRTAQTLAFVLATAAVTAAAAPARADDDPDKAPTIANLGKQASYAWNEEKPDSMRARYCLAAVDGLEKAKTPATASVPIEKNSGNLKKGTATLAEVKAECRRAYGASIIPRLQGSTAAGALMDELRSFDPSDNHAVNTIGPLVRNCNALTAEAVEYGLDPSQPVKLEHADAKWSGTLAELKTQICDKGAAALKAAVEAQLGPFKAVGIAGDKLDMIEEYYPLGFYIPGGSYSEGDTDPKALKKANVWFVISEGEACGVDKIEYFFKRYQFDKNQKIAKQSSKEYCGDPGPKVLK